MISYKPGDPCPCCFDGRVFRFAGHGETIDLEPIRWMVLPPVEENVPDSGTGEE